MHFIILNGFTNTESEPGNTTCIFIIAPQTSALFPLLCLMMQKYI